MGLPTLPSIGSLVSGALGGKSGPPVYTVGPSNAAAGFHSISPSWMAVFWPYEDGRTGVNNNNKLRDPVTVLNDAVSVSVSRTKSEHIKNATITLKLSDIEFDKILKPNDYVALWLCNYEEDITHVVQSINSGKGGNDFNSGFKFIGRISNVTKSISVAPSGIPSISVTVTARMFTEFDLSVYVSRLYEELFVEGNSGSANNTSPSGIQNQAFLQILNPKLYQDLVTNKTKFLTPDQIVSFLAGTFLGGGVTNMGSSAAIGSRGARNIGNKIVVPKEMYASILGKSVKDSYIENIYFYTGVEKFQGNNKQDGSDLSPVVKGGSSNPLQTSVSSFRQSTSLKGVVYFSSLQFDNITLWEFMNRYRNDSVNEMYTTMRFEPKGGIRPTFVLRQIPFTTPFLDILTKKHPQIQKPKGADASVTNYANLPRWKIDKTLVTSMNIGFTGNPPVNLVHVFSTPLWASGAGINVQNANALFKAYQFVSGNLIYDEQDILRNGLNAYIKESNFDNLLNQDSKPDGGKGAPVYSPFWSLLQSDFLFNLHLKLSGRISCFGIQEPIAEGDNLELDGVLYHIEGVEHVAQQAPDGKKRFQTVLTLSNGTLVESLESVAKAEKLYPTVGIPHGMDPFGRTQTQKGGDRVSGDIGRSIAQGISKFLK